MPDSNKKGESVRIGADLAAGGWNGDFRRHEADVAAVLANTPFLLTRCSADFRYLFVSDACARMLGRRPDEIEGKLIADVIGEEGFQTILPQVRRVLNGEVVEWEGDIDYAGAGLRRVIVTYTPDRDRTGGITGWIASIVDVTDKQRADARIAADLEAMTLLQQLGSLYVREDASVEECLEATLDAAIRLAGAAKGNVQAFHKSSNALHIVAQRGFGETFLAFFKEVDHQASACGAAMRAKQQIVVEDVPSSAIFDGQARQILAEEAVRAVISTPLVSSKGSLMGMISVHFPNTHRPDEHENSLIALLARGAADYLERKEAERLEKTLLDELNHRCNNLLFVVQAVASLTVDPGAARDSFISRLHALARSNRVIMQANCSAVELGDVVRNEFGPFAGRARISGAPVMLPPGMVQSFTLLLHELAANAAKYGSLSNDRGRVLVSWTVERTRDGRILFFEWQEIGGPEVSAPLREGFGTRLMKATFPGLELSHPHAGLLCRVKTSLPDDTRSA